MITKEQYLEAVSVVEAFHKQVKEIIELNKGLAEEPLFVFSEAARVLKDGNKIKILSGLNGNVKSLKIGGVYAIDKVWHNTGEDGKFRSVRFRLILENGKPWQGDITNLGFAIIQV